MKNILDDFQEFDFFEPNMTLLINYFKETLHAELKIAKTSLNWFFDIVQQTNTHDHKKIRPIKDVD